MISVQNISIQFGGKYLFENLNFQISPNDRIGLIGPNGVGKTTLLKILSGITQADSGIVQKANYVSIGYLPQDTINFSDRTLYEEAKSAFEDINILQNQLDEINNQILNYKNVDTEEYQELLEIQSEIQFKLECSNAHLIKSQIEKVLMGLGFYIEDFERPVREFSGGWQMRIALAKLLLSNPSLLMLDEPTNHLDLDSLRWLEEYLNSYKGAVIIVSHDRAFLDNMTKKIFAIVNGKLEIYHGNYSFYERESRIRRENLINSIRNQQQKIKQTQRFIERFRYKATKARQVQSRIKQLEKIELIEVEPEDEEITFSFPETKPSGAIVAEAINLTKSYFTSKSGFSSRDLEKLVFSDLNFRIERGDRIALVGVNGSGKSTLTKILSGIEQPTSGIIKFGHNVLISYFAQSQVDELHNDMEVIQVAEAEASGQTQAQLRTLLGCFLFKGDDVFKKVKVLSGGEKSRLALVKMLLKPANFLVMDEPTNHLDMKSKKVLQDALSNFNGTYLIVSHDRHFLDPIINKVIEIKDGKIKTYLGNISDYIQKLESEKEKVQTTITQSNKPVNDLKIKKRIEAEERQKLYKLTKPIKDKLADIENQIKEKEKLKQQCEVVMLQPDFFSDKQRVITTNNEYKKLTNELEKLYEDWAYLSDELENILNNSKKN
ncbi:MAG: ATPase [Ignavibacteriae bacterium]|nr:MAG: ATPase [Ignavibacteriota bacterium]